MRPARCWDRESRAIWQSGIEVRAGCLSFRRTLIKSVDDYINIRRWIDQIGSELPLEDAIQIVTARMSTADDEVQYILEGELADLFFRAGRDDEALEVLGKTMKRNPDDVRSAIKRATRYLYYLSEPEEALRCIDVALERAYRTLFFIREALGVKARILLQLGRGEQLSDVLEEIMSLQITNDIPDVGRERDFIDRAPSGLIRPHVLDRYNQFRPKRAGDSIADEPPEYLPPDDAM